MIESNYSVSTDPNDRAICGLSANGASVHTLIGMYPEAFGYYAAFSSGPENVILDPGVLNQKVIFETAGCVDFCASNTEAMKATFDELGINYCYSEVDGAHDWGCWRESLTIFAKDYLWDPVVEEIPPVEVPENNPNIEENVPITPPEANQSENVSTSIDEKKTAVKTGDETPIISFAALTIICFGAMVVLKRQQVKS